jgi:hypothetical protein
VTLTILEGSTFCICDDRGDVGEKTSGFYAHDTRFLSILRMTIDGKPPLLLSSSKVEYFSAAFYLRNPLSDGLPPDTLSIARRRFVGEGMQERIVIRNEGTEPVSFSLGLEIGCDFADIFAVKDYDFALGDPLRAKPLPDPRPNEYDGERNQFLISDNGGLPLKTQVLLSQRGDVHDSAVHYHLALSPRERWELHVEVIPLPDGEEVAARFAERRFGEEVGRVRDSLAAWQLRVPQLRTSWDALSHSFGQSVSDLASLRMRSNNSGIGKLPGAGVPWFMTVFGRDTIITCLQTLIFGPELARTALDCIPVWEGSVEGLHDSILPWRRHPDPAVRLAAIRADGAEIDWRQWFAGEESRTVRSECVARLAEAEGAGALHDLLAYLEDDAWEVRAAARDGLIAIGEPARVPVRQRVTHPLEEVRVAAALVLVGLDDDAWLQENVIEKVRGGA